MSTNSYLSIGRKQTVLFDAANVEHRRWAHRFVKERNWHGCPYAFALPGSEPNVYTMVTRLLTEYYGDQEFSVIRKSKPGLRAVL
jgi:hypothetical protein